MGKGINLVMHKLLPKRALRHPRPRDAWDRVHGKVAVDAAIPTAVGSIAGGYLGESFGWRTAFLVVGLFAVTQMPLIKRYHLEPASLEASDADAGDVSKG